MSKSVKKLAKYPGIWRVNGYSNIELYTNSAPRVFVSLTRIKESGSDAALYNGQLTKEQIWLKEPLSRISDLLIGSCWHGGSDGKGKRINRPSPMKKPFLIDTSEIQIVKLNEPVTLNGQEYKRVLPSRAIRFDQHYPRMKKSLYAVAPVLNDEHTKFLVVSCYELYRAYLGVSSGFINNIVQGDVGRFFEWNDPTLRVKRRLSRLEQFVAYRGHYDEDGRKCFYMPSNHLKATRMSNQFKKEGERDPLVVKATFPFRGLTVLNVAGKAFRNVNSNGSVWCVFAANLLHCSKPVDFDVDVESDKFSRNPVPWVNEGGALDSGEEDPFDEEAPPGNEDPPNIGGRRAYILNFNNFFGAMKDVSFKHFDTGESKDPVYENDTGDPIDANSLDELEPPQEDAPKILQTSEFDSYIDTVGRDLSGFIEMLNRLRELLAKYGWEVRTRGGGDAHIMTEGEVVTTLLETKDRRRSWHRIGKGEDARLRQIVWVEIALGNDQFIYLMEIELTESESGRSTLCVFNNNFKYMNEEDFRVFLGMTAIQNGWPRESHQWKSDKATVVANKYFSTYIHFSITHPVSTQRRNGKKVPIDSDKLKSKWASNIEENLSDIVNYNQ